MSTVNSRNWTLADLRRLASTDSNGNEKEVLSFHDGIMARVLAPPLVWLFLRMGLSADFVTLLSILNGLAGAAALGFGTVAAGLCAVALLQFSYLLDCADGDIARARGTSSLDGYMRDVSRHCVMGPAIFCGWTMALFSERPESGIVLTGLICVLLSTRMVGDLDDRITFEGVLQRLKKAQSVPVINSAAADHRSLSFRIRSHLLSDRAIMNWLSLAVPIDAFLLRGQFPFSASLITFYFLAAAHVILKTGGMILLWRRGVSARVDALIPSTHSDSAKK